MSKVVINFKVDPEVKEQAQALAKELGVPLSTVINAQLKQFLRTRSFSVNTDLHMSPYLEAILEETESDRKAGRNFSKVFSSADEMFASLKQE